MLIGDCSPIIAGRFAAINTTPAVSITATHGSAAGNSDASKFRVMDEIRGKAEIRFKDSGSRRFSRVKLPAC
jgi:hypothetical protein